jgi:UDPglucose 6-dehydrogenase
VVTEWRQFRDLNLAELRRAMSTPILVDGRNLYTPEEAAAAGFDYTGIGRPAARARAVSAAQKTSASAPVPRTA